MEPSAAKTKMAVARNSEMAARMVSGCVASSLRPTVNRRPGLAAAVLISTPITHTHYSPTLAAVRPTPPPTPRLILASPRLDHQVCSTAGVGV
uniref:Uncharacterized protein n=1 Tax=Oryza meridionalis TaxID=40149 RepID=A0A0E0EZA6_9ORYZ